MRREGEAWTGAEGGLGQCSPTSSPGRAGLSRLPFPPDKPAGGKLGMDVEGVSPVLCEYPGQQGKTKLWPLSDHNSRRPRHWLEERGRRDEERHTCETRRVQKQNTESEKQDKESKSTDIAVTDSDLQRLKT